MHFRISYFSIHPTARILKLLTVKYLFNCIKKNNGHLTVLILQTIQKSGTLFKCLQFLAYLLEPERFYLNFSPLERTMALHFALRQEDKIKKIQDLSPHALII